MKQLIYVFIAVLPLTFLSGCFGDLDIELRDDDLFLADDFYDSTSSYRQALASAYANLSITGPNGPGSTNLIDIDPGYSQYLRCYWYVSEFTTDEVKWSWENDPGLAELNRNTWNSENPWFRGFNGRAGTSIAFVNEFLRQTTDEKLDERGHNDPALRDEIRIYRAEARLLRALAHYHLLDLFRQSPLVTENDPVSAKQPQIMRAEELFAYIEAELLATIPDLVDPKQNEYGRVDKAVAWMILAKLYLNAEVYAEQDRYSDAMTYIQEIINSNQYTLTPNYLHNFTGDNDVSGADEVIFGVISDAVATQNYGATTSMINGQVGNLEQNGISLGTNAGGWGGAMRVTRQFSETMLSPTYANDDRNTLLPPGERPIDITEITRNGTGYIIEKWNNNFSTGPRPTVNEFADIDFPLFRYADVLLMYAECHLRGGGGDRNTAIQYLNDLRIRANNTVAVTNADFDLDLIIDERLVELHWEGHRRQDLIRFGLFTSGNYTWNWKGNALNGIPLAPYREVFPIHTADLAANPNYRQNPGY